MWRKIEKFLKEHHYTRKFLHQLGWAIVGGFVVVMPGFADVIKELLPQYAYFIVPIFVSLIIPLQSWYKHRNDKK